LSGREWALMIPTVAMAIFMGVAPSLFLRTMEPSVVRTVDRTNGVQVTAESVPRVPAPAAGVRR